MDTSTNQFLSDVMNWYVDENYFPDNAELIQGGYWDYEVECGWYFWGQQWEYECEYIPYWVDVEYYDFSVFNPSAIEIYEKAKDLWENGIGSVNDIVEVLESVFGVAIGGFDLCVNGGPEFDDSDDCRGYEFNVALHLANNAREEETGRAAGTLWVTGRRVLKSGHFHLALEYTNPLTGLSNWFSGNQQNVLPIPFGNELVSRMNDPVDSPLVMDKMGYVDLVYSGEWANAALIQLTEDYCNCLEYDAIPSPVSNAYNSNGYLHALYNRLGGQMIFTHFVITSNLPGWTKPVPQEYFPFALPPPF
jgi:hypothetical protein